MQEYILDACALLALFDDEEGADIVENILEQARNNEAALIMNAANLIEVYYVTCDHVELEPVQKQGIVPFLWIRPQF
ncbi:MAG: PIN domain-containing protein [Treponema sp.]|nr:PIN domain-containing protein [Treponema sp.]